VATLNEEAYIAEIAKARPMLEENSLWNVQGLDGEGRTVAEAHEERLRRFVNRYSSGVDDSQPATFTRKTLSTMRIKSVLANLTRDQLNGRTDHVNGLSSRIGRAFLNNATQELDPVVFRAAIRFRYGLFGNVPDSGQVKCLSTTHGDSGRPINPHEYAHLLTCTGAARPNFTKRHNHLRDATMAAFSRQGWYTTGEITIDTAEQMQSRIDAGLYPAGTEAKATIADAQLAAPGKNVVIDFHVTARSPLQRSADSDEKTKRNKYEEVMRANPSLTFQPIVITAYGTLGKDTEAFLNRNMKTWKPANKTMLYKDLSLILAHYNGVMSMMALCKGVRKDQFPSFNKHFKRTG